MIKIAQDKTKTKQHTKWRYTSLRPSIFSTYTLVSFHKLKSVLDKAKINLQTSSSSLLSLPVVL